MEGRDLTGRDLENTVARLFREAGCQATVRATVPGARHKENVDVLVEFESFGIAEAWVVECKDQAEPVNRGDVQILQKKVENIGASRGLMVSRSGYQSGCEPTAANSNILLKSLEWLNESLLSEISRQRLLRLLARVTSLLDNLSDMRKYGERRPGKPFRYGATVKFPTGPRSEEYSLRFRRLSFIKEQITEVLVGDSVYLIPSDEDDPSAEETLYEVISSRREFCDVLERVLADSEQWAHALVPPE